MNTKTATTEDQIYAVDALSDSMENDSEKHEDNREDVNKHIEEIKQKYPNLSSCGRWQDKKLASECGKIGGAKAGITKRKRRLMREAAQAILSADVSKLPIPEMEDLKIALQALGIDEITGADAILLAQSIRAAKGDTEAARFVRDTSGEKPSVSVDVVSSDRPLDADVVSTLSDDDLAMLAEGAEDIPQLPKPQAMLQ